MAPTMGSPARWLLVAVSGGMCFALASCAPAARVDHPLLTGRPPDMRIILPQRMERALEASGPGFRTHTIADFDSEIVKVWPGWSYHFDPAQAPFGVIGDFDGDRRWDAALLQHSASESRFVVVLDRSPSPEVIELSRHSTTPETKEAKLWWFLVRVPPGEIRIPNWEIVDVDTTIDLANDAVEIVYFEKGAVMYCWHDGRFVEIATAD